MAAFCNTLSLAVAKVYSIFIPSVAFFFVFIPLGQGLLLIDKTVKDTQKNWLNLNVTLIQHQCKVISGVQSIFVVVVGSPSSAVFSFLHGLVVGFKEPGGGLVFRPCGLTGTGVTPTAPHAVVELRRDNETTVATTSTCVCTDCTGYIDTGIQAQVLQCFDRERTDMYVVVRTRPPSHAQTIAPQSIMVHLDAISKQPVVLQHPSHPLYTWVGLQCSL